jgi:ketosteroid isomerase-like protein
MRRCSSPIPRWGRGNFSEGADLYDANVLLVLRREFGLASGMYCRPAERADYMRNVFLTEWDDAVIAGEEFIEAGDSVVVRVDQRATGRQSGTPVQMGYFQVWTFRGGSVIRIESIINRADAQASGWMCDGPHGSARSLVSERGSCSLGRPVWISSSIPRGSRSSSLAAGEQAQAALTTATTAT